MNNLLQNVNMDVETGIRYGVMTANSVPFLWDEVEEQVTDTCPYCGSDVEDILDKEKCPHCGEEYSEYTEYNTTTVLDKDGVHGMVTEEGYLFVFKSPYVTYCRKCSPCVPNAGDLDSPDYESGVATYCLPPDFFEEKELPHVCIPADVFLGKRKPNAQDVLDVCLQILRCFPNATYIPHKPKDDFFDYYDIKDWDQGTILDEGVEEVLPDGCIVGVALQLLGIDMREFALRHFPDQECTNIGVATLLEMLVEEGLLDDPHTEDEKEELIYKLDFIRFKNDSKIRFDEIYKDCKERFCKEGQ